MSLFDMFKKKRADSPSNEQTVINNMLSPVKNKPDEKYVIVRILQKVSYNGIVLSKNPDDYPRWLVNDLEIKDPYTKLCDLRELGYIKNVSADVCLKKRTLAELKEELQRQGLSVKGKKAELIERLVNEGELSASFVPEVLELTEKGSQFIEENKELIEINNIGRFGITTDEFYSMKNKMQGDDFYSVVIHVLLEQDKILMNLNEVSMSRAKKWTIAMTYEEQGNKSLALQYYIYSAYYSMCELNWDTDLEYNIDGTLALKIYALKDSFDIKMIRNCYDFKIGGHYKAPDKNKFQKTILEIINGVEMS